MKRAIFLIVFSLFSVVVNTYGQYNTNENKKWVFGRYGGLDFMPGSPVSFITSINQYEGCASVSDAAGSLLFYTDGLTVWDRTGAIMPNGNSIVVFGTVSCSQAACIVPFPGHPGQYYLFSLEQGSVNGRFAYCMVDMALNGGLGDVIAATRGTQIDTGMSEKMTCVRGDNCDIWLLAHRVATPRFMAYDITSAGIASPVISTSGSFTSSVAYYASGVMKVSPNRRKIVVESHYYSKHTELFDFDPSTGIVSSCQLLNTESAYGAEFSPDNTKLYSSVIVGVSTSVRIDQYDISLGSTPAIVASRVTISAPSCFAGDLKLGPDGKIYVANWGSPFHTMDRIDTPDAPGLACGYEVNAITLPGLQLCNIGLPNMVYTAVPGDTTFVHHDTTICAVALSAATIAAQDTAAVSQYLWDDGTTTRTRTITAASTYWVSTIDQCNLTIDTIHVLNSPVVGAIAGPDSVCTAGAAITLNNTTGGGVWSVKNAHASISASGVVTGATAGADTVLYVVNTVCGADTMQHVLAVHKCKTGVSDVNVSRVPEIFPNPGRGTFTVNLNSDIDEVVTIVITDVMGKKVKEFTTATNKAVDVKLNEGAGVYFLSATDGVGRYFVKIVVE